MRIGETRGPAAAVTIQGRTVSFDLWRISREEWRRRHSG